MNTLLRRLLGVLLGLALTGQVYAQQSRQERLNQLENAKIAYLTDKLSLSQEQAQRFWPVYNEFTDKRRDLNRRMRQLRSTPTDGLSDKQIRDNLTQGLALRQNEVDLEKDYFNKVQKVLSMQQVGKLYAAEREFTKVLLRRLDGRRGAPGPAGEASN
ncbi:hypothetical protein [Hymenobacter jejuensis]|uniref:Periplasmic heavy metal sensor n=1 Tax=Hymenobacter jejuensis TaxID=2502781 RepID=A0A5B8A283_9BACT|nr:hypothetical protein [Hymenobacter jejuensis]QDA61501.1 hypothetical protein FHG12_15970 [Hymenobacter jejuensis]